VLRFFNRAAEVVTPRLRELSVVQLIKIILAIGRIPTCRPLLEDAGASAIGRMTEIFQNPAHLFLLLQGLLPLGGSHQVVSRILELLVTAFQEASRQELLLGPDLVIDRRRELEVKGQLSADHLAKLAQTLAPAVPDIKSFWEAWGSRLAEMPKSLTTAGHASLVAAFPDKDGGPSFESKSRLLRTVASAQAAKERGARDADDMTKQEKAYQRQKEWEKREEEHKKRMDREYQAEDKERQRLREMMLRKNSGGKRSRSRSRSRSQGRNRSRDRKEKDKDKKRQRSRSRSRDRRRSRSRDRRRK